MSIEYFFIDSYKKNNKSIGKIFMRDIVKFDIIIPNEQRICDKDKVNEIIDYQDKYKKQHGFFNFLGLINIHYCIEDKKYYLVDGQHRYKSMKKLYNIHNYKNLELDIELISVETRKDLKHNYKMINKNTELPEFPDDIDKNIPELTATFFFNEYPDIWTKKKRNIRPFLNKNQFQEAIGYLLSKINKNKTDGECDVEELKRIISEKNDKMSNWQVEIYIKNIRKIKKWPEYLLECHKHLFFLGMYSHSNEEYCYDWVKDIVKDYTGENLKKEPKNRKKKIPKNLKNEVWNFYNKKESTTAKCYCCFTKELHIMSWHCGHVIAENKGGLMAIENLRPICRNCNLTMGTDNLYDFMKKFYPLRFKSIEKEKKEKKVKMDKKEKEENERKAKKYFFF